MFRNREGLKQAFEQEVGATSFLMSRLVQKIDALEGELLSQQREFLGRSLGLTAAQHVLNSLWRTSFLLETVLRRGGATKMSVRWTPRLDQDVRQASFEECCRIFEKLVGQLADALGEQSNRELLSGFATHRLMAYEIPVDYRQRRVEGAIHEAENLEWIWSPLPFQVVRLRGLLRTRHANPYSTAFAGVYEKIAVKTYLTDRAQTGEYQTNREKRWESQPMGFQFALRRDCWGVEATLMNQVCHFAGFPGDLFQQLDREGVLMPIPTPYRCPITLDALSFEEFQEEVLAPQHGKARFQVGHLNPLRAIDQTGSGHTGANIGWISEDGNRIQGHLSLAETRALLQRIVANYQDTGLAQG